MRATLLASALLVVLLASPALAGSAREEALALLGAAEAGARRQAIAALAEVGTMEDLPALAAALRDGDAGVRALAEPAMWRVWSRSGDPAVDALFAAGLEQMAAGDGRAAVETFTRVIERRPDFAEGWNKRATVYYQLGELEKSLADCDEVMKRNPYHWGALSGYGMIHLELGDPARALAYFERALAVNPNLGQVEEAAAALRRLLLQRRRNAI